MWLLTTQLLDLQICFGSPCVESINLVWILYPRKLLRSPILVGYQRHTNDLARYHPHVVVTITNCSNIANNTSNAPENRTIGYNGDFLPWKTIWWQNDELLFSFKQKYVVSSCKCFQIADDSLMKAMCLPNRGRCPLAVRMIWVMLSDWPEPKPHGSYVCTIEW